MSEDSQPSRTHSPVVVAPASITDRLELVARRHVERRIPPDPSGELAAMALSDLLVIYGSWRQRFIEPRPRSVHLSREFEEHLPRSLYTSVISDICAALDTGGDLTPHLSTDVLVAHMPDEKRARNGREGRRHIDTMLAHDGLHHLHLGKGDGRFVPRTDDLLLLAVRPNDAYLIGIYPHGVWGHTDVLRRMIRNWPDAGLAIRLDHVLGVERDFTDAERWQLMEAGVSLGPIEVDGKFYALESMGQTLAGTPSVVARRVMSLMWEITCIRERGLRQRLLELGADPAPDWVPTVRDERLGLERRMDFVHLGQMA